MGDTGSCGPASIGPSSIARARHRVRPSVADAELLDSDGDEVHSAGQPTLTGRDHLDAQLAFADYAAFRSWRLIERRRGVRTGTEQVWFNVAWRW